MSSFPPPDEAETFGVISVGPAGYEDPSQEDELADYLEQLEHALGLVAAYARFEPELTLWCARRVAELCLRSIHVHFGAGTPKKRHPSFPELLAHPIPGHRLQDVLGLANLAQLDMVQRLGNIGVHARRDGRKEARDSVRTATAAVVAVVDALFGPRALGPHRLSAGIRKQLGVVRSGGRTERLDDAQLAALQQEVERWREKARELADHVEALAAFSPPPAPDPALERLLDDTRTALRAAEAEAVRARAQAVADREALHQAQEQLVALRQAHADQLEEVGAQLATVPMAVAVEDESVEDESVVVGLRRKARRRLAGNVLMVTVLGVVLWGRGGTTDRLDGLLEGLPETGAEGGSQAVVQAAAVAPVSRAAGGARACGEGTVEVAAIGVSIAPPADRPSWPRPRSRRPRTVEVERFCIDVDPVGRADDPGSRPCRGNPLDFDGDPATCVSREEAELGCARRGGRLPTVAQWEALAQQGLDEELSRGVPREWVADVFPPAVFSMDGASDPKADAMFRDRSLDEVESPELRWSWNRQPSVRRWTNLGYRCVFSPGETTATR
jgi:formylglycine-generating enzyme required for sulfatase activity